MISSDQFSSTIIRYIIQCWTQYKHSATLWILLYFYLYNQLLLAYLIHIISVTILPLYNNDWCNIPYLDLATLLYILILRLLKSCPYNLFLQPDDGSIAKPKHAAAYLIQWYYTKYIQLYLTVDYWFRKHEATLTEHVLM
jgi:hypothetical protein